MDFTSPEGEQRYAALVRAASSAVVALDFDGTLSPIVDDPEASDVLVELAGAVAAVAVVTGRPARQALALGGLDDVGNLIGEGGKELYLFGQYGNERWTSTQRRVISPRPPHGLATFLRELPRALRSVDAGDAFVEDKGLAVAVHTRRLEDPEAAFERLLPKLRDLAEQHDLVVEPGRNVIEIRSHGMHKGLVVRTLVEELEAGAFLFAGDDLGDLEAFEAVGELAREGMPTLLVCSASTEESRLAALADVVVKGPEGVLDLLRQLATDARDAKA